MYLMFFTHGSPACCILRIDCTCGGMPTKASTPSKAAICGSNSLTELMVYLLCAASRMSARVVAIKGSLSQGLLCDMRSVTAPSMRPVSSR